MESDEMILLKAGLAADGKTFYTAAALKSAVEAFNKKLPMPIMTRPGSDVETGIEIFSVRVEGELLLGRIRPKV